MRRSTGVFFPILFIFLAACGGRDKKDAAPSQNGKGGPQKQPPLSVEAMIVTTRELSADIEVPGSLLANESTEIHPEVSGRLVLLNIKEGAVVGKGTLLARLYDGDMQAQLKKLQEQIKKSEVQLKIAEQNEERSSKLLKIQGISQQDYDMSVLQVNNITADIGILKAEMEAIRANMSKLNIYTPYSGKLGLKNISPGSFVTPSTIITTISQVNQLKLQFNVPEKYGSLVKKGQAVDFTVDGSQKTFNASIMATEDAIEENTRSLAVRALIKNNDPALLPGAFARVKIILGKNEEALMIPNSSIVPQGRKKLIFLAKNNKAISTEVTTGVRDSTNIQVLSGLNKGDTVITSGLLFVKPNADIKVILKN
ncbi:MAG: efflux RND transporter periplasmic adaptor subunit [Sphingobacteriales bacterium]|nr:efflux RND transporter periplasmic adaptor subunit [Sphingobacteriales bacterium]